MTQDTPAALSLDEFKHWLNDWRMANVSEKFHEIVRHYRAALASPTSAAVGALGDIAAFKNFHRSLCARFGYTHDERYWWRDLVSLEEHIAALAAQSPDSGAGPELHQMLHEVLGALEDGVDALAEVRSSFKEAYKGHYPERHARMEADVLAAEAARAKLDAYLNGAALAQQGAQNG